MYCITVYDISSARTLQRILKICRRYQTRVQNSVFEGHLTNTQFERLSKELTTVINPETDSLYFYTFRSKQLVDKIIKGKKINEISNFF